MSEENKAVFKIFIRGRIEDVWREIATVGVPLQGIFNAVMHASGQLAKGVKIQMRSVSNKLAVVIGEVLEYDPPRRFVHTHRFTQYDDPFVRVAYDLEPKDGGVELTLTVFDIPLGTKTEADMRRGGTFMVNNIKAIVENGRPPLSTRIMYWLFGKLEFVLPKKTHVENWPLNK
jgi:hypothetical protein